MNNEKKICNDCEKRVRSLSDGGVRVCLPGLAGSGECPPEDTFKFAPSVTTRRFIRKELGSGELDSLGKVSPLDYLCYKCCFDRKECFKYKLTGPSEYKCRKCQHVRVKHLAEQGQIVKCGHPNSEQVGFSCPKEEEETKAVNACGENGYFAEV